MVADMNLRVVRDFARRYAQSQRAPNQVAETDSRVSGIDHPLQRTRLDGSHGPTMVQTNVGLRPALPVPRHRKRLPIHKLRGSRSSYSRGRPLLLSLMTSTRRTSVDVC